MTKAKIILDTNTLVSSILIRNSRPDLTFKKAKDIGLLIFSNATFDELEQVLQRKKFDKYVVPEVRRQFLDSLRQRALFISIQSSIQACRDPKDNKFLELAADGQADYLITGDQDLLVLHPFQKTKILTPAQFLEL